MENQVWLSDSESMVAFTSYADDALLYIYFDSILMAYINNNQHLTQQRSYIIHVK